MMTAPSRKRILAAFGLVLELFNHAIMERRSGLEAGPRVVRGAA